MDCVQQSSTGGGGGGCGRILSEINLSELNHIFSIVSFRKFKTPQLIAFVLQICQPRGYSTLTGNELQVALPSVAVSTELCVKCLPRLGASASSTVGDCLYCTY
jgi:hypothetical protein